jgi:hypothetical protein
VVDEHGVYNVRNAQWAEPDVEDAAAWLKRLFDDSALRQQMGAAGQAHAQQTLGAAPLQAALTAAGVTA